MSDAPETNPAGAGSQSWWLSLPGILTGIAATVTALGGLLSAVNGLEWFKKHSPPDGVPVTAAQSTAPLRPNPVSKGNPTTSREAKEPDLNVRTEAASGTHKRVASQLVGRWTWGQPCTEGPSIRVDGQRIVFDDAQTPFVHEILSDDGAKLRTKVISPSDHAGETYNFTIDGGKLTLLEDQTKERNVWTRCKD